MGLGKPLLSESVSASPLPHEPRSDLLESWGTRRCNWGPQLLSESDSTSPQPHFLPESFQDLGSIHRRNWQCRRCRSPYLLPRNSSLGMAWFMQADFTWSPIYDITGVRTWSDPRDFVREHVEG
jgi:hypothetical protein